MKKTLGFLALTLSFHSIAASAAMTFDCVGLTDKVHNFGEFTRVRLTNDVAAFDRRLTKGADVMITLDGGPSQFALKVTAITESSGEWKLSLSPWYYPGQLDPRSAGQVLIIRKTPGAPSELWNVLEDGRIYPVTTRLSCSLR